MHFYRVDLLDFYRGTMSARRLGLLVKQLPADSALNRAMNGGAPPMSRLEHFIADIWALWAKQDHPVRAEIEAKANHAAKSARVLQMNEKRKRHLRIGVT